MVCPRCVSSVEQIFDRNGIHARQVRLGEVELDQPVDTGTLASIAEDLRQTGFELLDDQKSRQIEQIKQLLIQKVQEGSIEEHFSISKYITQYVFRDYSSLSKLFSTVEGITIEQFFILQKMEKVKEWLMYNEYSLSDIAFRLGYSSTQHLSSQFRKVTGMTPGAFKKLGADHRKPIDQVQK
jgi:AraC family transcriptional regulator